MSIARVNPLGPRARIYEIATHLFVNGGWRGLQCLRLARVHGERAMLEELEVERCRAEASGSWGNWGRLVASLGARRPPKRPIPHVEPRRSLQGPPRGPERGRRIAG